MGSSLLGWVVNKFDSFLNAPLEAGLAWLKELFLACINVAENVVSLFGTRRLRFGLVGGLKQFVGTSTYPKLDRDREKVNTSFLCDDLTAWDAWEVDVCGLDDSLLSIHRLHKLFGKAIPRKLIYAEMWKTQNAVTYRKPAYAIDRVAEPAPPFASTTSSPPNCTPRMDQPLISTDKVWSRTLDESGEFVLRNVDLGLSQTEQRYDRLARMASNHRNDGLGRIFLASDTLNKRFRADDVEGGDSEQLLGVELSSLFHHFGRNGDGRVDRI